MLERKINAFDKAVYDEVAQIIIRTQAGVDVHGQPFAPYTPKYAKKRLKAGRNVSPVDLTFNGTMLASMQQGTVRTPTGAESTISFGSAREAAKAAGNQERREFFGLSDEQVARIVSKVTEG